MYKVMYIVLCVFLYMLLVNVQIRFVFYYTFYVLVCMYIMIQLLLYILLENLQICFVSYNCAFTPSTKVRHDSIQSQRRDANRANFSLMTRFDFHFCPARASAFTWICSMTLLLKFKYFNFAAN